MRPANPKTSGSRLALYANAVRSMHARQLAHRVRRALPLQLLAAGTHERAPRDWRPLAAGLAVDPAPQSGPQDPPDGRRVFAVVGATRSFVDGPEFWSAGEQGLLFAFHLHGFAELARYTASPRSPAGDSFWSAVITSWLQHAGAPSLPGWHPYPLSGRMMAWCAALSSGDWPAELQQQMLASLVRQMQVLRRSVEHEIGGNHVLRNAVALTFAGSCLGDAAVQRRALRLLQSELRLQLLADGGHEERSTSYHRTVRAELSDVTTLLGRDGVSPPGWLDEARERMHAWERTMRGPDGELPLLNDAWEGPAEAAAPNPEAVTVLRESGYVVLRHGRDQLIVDAGPISPAHLPAHAHSDVLSFVLWADGRQLVVDPGTFAYTGPQRNTFRGTGAHNTVEVDGTDQCQFWGDFRAAFIPNIVRLDVTEREGGVVVVAARHDGYRRLADGVEHERWFCWAPEDGLVVIDVLHAERSHRAASRLHLAPQMTTASTTRVGPFIVQTLGPGSPAAVVPGQYSPHLGTQMTIQVLERSGTIAPHAPFGWALLRPGAHAVLDGRQLVVTRRNGERVIVDVG